MFSSWSDIWRVVGVTSVIFIFIVAVMRLMGPQALARMSAFDMVFTVTLGSIIATAGVTRDITIAEAIAAIVCLLILQEIFRFLQSRSLKAHRYGLPIPGEPDNSPKTSGHKARPTSNFRLP